MALIVHKYGGTSMGSGERIAAVARRVAKWARAGHRMVVVPSAMSGETNRLLGLAAELAPEHKTDATRREMDMLAASGEQASAALLAIALQAQGLPAISFTGWQVPVQTDSSYTKARIASIDGQRVRAALDQGARLLSRVQRVEAVDVGPRDEPAGLARGDDHGGGGGLHGEIQRLPEFGQHRVRQAVDRVVGAVHVQSQDTVGVQVQVKMAQGGRRFPHDHPFGVLLAPCIPA